MCPLVELANLFGHCHLADMDDQGIEARPPLGLKDLDHRFRIIGACAQPIDRFGRQVDQLACLQGENSRITIRHQEDLAFKSILTVTLAGMESVAA